MNDALRRILDRQREEIMAAVDRRLADHARSYRNIATRGTIAAVDDERKMQDVQVKTLTDEIIDNAERAQNYGFSSHPLEGAEVFVLTLNADRSHPVIIVCDDRNYRPTAIEPGEVIVYTHEGDYIHLKKDNHIEVKTKHLLINAEDDVTINTKAMTINADTIENNAEEHFTIDTPLIGIRTNAITQWARDEGTPKVRAKGDIYHEGLTDQIGDYVQDGKHTSTDDQVAGTVSQQHHLHEKTQPGGGFSGEPQK